ncbi:MAG: endonuclease/exonuclease/phosphatase family protein [Bacteroidota bacterium]
MKKILLYVLMLGLTNCLFAQDSLRIMTYNLEGMKPGSDPATRIQYIIQNLKQLNPDIIGVQEINDIPPTGKDNQAKAIADSLNAYFHIPYYTYMGFTHLSWDNQFNEYVGIITKYPVFESGYFQLVKGSFPRKVVWNRISTPFGFVNFYNTHLDHLSSDIRLQQVQQIISYTALKDSVLPQVASILTGDFNDEASTSTIRALTNPATGPVFIDSYRAANLSLPGYTVPADNPYRRIDFIFTKNSSQLKVLSSNVVMDIPYSGFSYPSDHRGVMTVFTKKETSVSGNTNAGIPSTVRLFQNYPNPFNPTTVIRYSLPEGPARSVRVEIVDLLGRILETLVHQKQSAGEHSIQWNAAGRSSGIYFCRVSVDNYAITNRMVFMK